MLRNSSLEGLYFLWNNPSWRGFFVVKNMNAEIFHTVTNKKLLHAPVRGLMKEAHADDRTMGRIIAALARRGVGMTILTDTDGAASQLKNYTSEELPAIRWSESIAHAKHIGAAQVFNANFPDGQLSDHIKEARTVFQTIVDEVDPDFILAPHPLDPHPDHAAAYIIASSVANRLPLYAMDTITGFDRRGEPVLPTHTVLLTSGDAKRENQGYLLNSTQVTSRPLHEMEDVYNVLRMSPRRGRERNVRHATVLTKHPGVEADPLKEIFGRDIFIA